LQAGWYSIGSTYTPIETMTPVVAATLSDFFLNARASQ